MASLVGQQLKDTYDSLLKTSDNDALGGTYKEITDGSGNGSNLYLGTGGRVGIGASPTNTLTIKGGVHQLDIETDSSGVSFESIDRTALGDSSDISYYARNGNHKFFNGTYTERMRIDSSGNVGIGVSPTAKLDIVDSSNPANTSGSVIIEGRRDGVANVLTLRAKDASAPTSALPNGQGSVLRWQGFDGTDFENMGYILVSADGQDVANGDAPSFMAFGTSANGSSNPTERMRIDSSGNVGIGTDSPDAPLTVHDDDSANSTTLKLANSFATDTAGDSSALMFQLKRSYASGVNDAGFIKSVKEKAWDATDDRDSALTFGTRAGASEPTERLRIDSSGRLLSGTETALSGFSGTAQRACFSATGDTMTVQVGTGTTAYTGIHVLRQNSNGKVLSFERNSTDVGSISVTTTATAYNTSSDYRLKENIVELDGALDKVLQLKPSTFNFKSDTDSTVSGFIAHEVQEVVPEAVTGEKDGMVEYEVTPAVLDDEGNVIEEAVMGTKPVYQGIDQSKLVPILVGAIQELKAEIEQLKNQ
jgi:hypothetical protein